MTRFRVGSASDVGQLRSNNQDSKLVASDVSLFAVADGMGGHQGGEVASAIAVETLQDVVDAPTPASLVEAVKEANRRIFAHANQAPELRGMGTTLVAIALVNQGAADEEITWVNVGDSRVYVLRDGQLHQLSQDHSLVEDLRRGGQLSAEEAAVHPQRNILTRALGIDAEVEVDWHGVQPFLGDRYLLCSDGLFNEVDQATLVEVLTTIDDPDAAATELVRLANAGGGRDNITCVVVDVVDDDGRAERAAAASLAGGSAEAVAATDATVVEPAPGSPAPGAADGDLTPPAGTPLPPPPADPVDPTLAEAVPTEDDILAGSSAYPLADDPDAIRAADEDLPFGRTTGDLYEDMDHVGGRHRATVALVVLALVLGIGAAVVLGIRYVDGDGYFIRAEGERVVVFKGQPDGGILFGPSEEVVGRSSVDELTPSARAELRRVPEFDSLDDARSRLNTWDVEASRAATSTTTTTTEPEGTTTTERRTTTTERPTTTSPPTTAAGG